MINPNEKLIVHPNPKQLKQIKKEVIEMTKKLKEWGYIYHISKQDIKYIELYSSGNVGI